MKITPAGVVEASTFKGALEGNASSATTADKLKSKVKIAVAGDATGEAETDFSEDVTINVQVASSITPQLTDDEQNQKVTIRVGGSDYDVARYGHDHDDRYYQKTEIDTFLDWKSIDELYPN
jgi:predicted phosphodiesterase